MVTPRSLEGNGKSTTLANDPTPYGNTVSMNIAYGREPKRAKRKPMENTGKPYFKQMVEGEEQPMVRTQSMGT